MGDIVTYYLVTYPMLGYFHTLGKYILNDTQLTMSDDSAVNSNEKIKL